jgi:AcrR family transcriptional regulator
MTPSTTRRAHGRSADPSRSATGSTREVNQIQRARMLAAVEDAVAESGYQRMTVTQIIRRAGVSRRTFYDIFADRDDCFLAVFEQIHSRAWALADEAYEQEAEWRDGVRSALSRLLMFIEEEPGLARLWIVEALGAGERVLERRAQAVEEYAKAIDKGRFASRPVAEPSPVTAAAIVGGVLGVLHDCLLKEVNAPLARLLNPLMSVIVLPYLGSGEASSELHNAPLQIEPTPRPSRSRRSEDPLEALKMRVTYRTVRVLMAIADNPGASNREIAEYSGVRDQGQMSKLLKRLVELKLVENYGEGAEKGVANAWKLTSSGKRVERATRAHQWLREHSSPH